MRTSRFCNIKFRVYFVDAARARSVLSRHVMTDHAIVLRPLKRSDVSFLIFRRIRVYASYFDFLSLQQQSMGTLLIYASLYSRARRISRCRSIQNI